MCNLVTLGPMKMCAQPRSNLAPDQGTEMTIFFHLVEALFYEWHTFVLRFECPDRVLPC